MFLQSARYEAVSFNWWLRGAANEHPPDLVEQDQEGACEVTKIRKVHVRLIIRSAPERLKVIETAMKFKSEGIKAPVMLKTRDAPVRLKI